MVRDSSQKVAVDFAAAALELIISVLIELDKKCETFLPPGKCLEFHIAMQTVIKTLTYWRQQLWLGRGG